MPNHLQSRTRDMHKWRVARKGLSPTTVILALVVAVTLTLIFLLS
ncbi:MAG: hypothetical protein AAF311_02665 [Pseudomonadota bacterium]